MLIDVIGRHLPASVFIIPKTPLRDALVAAGARRAVEISALGNEYISAGYVVDEKAIVNAIVALLGTGGSTNHTLHLVAIAKAAGIVIDRDDFDTLSPIVSLLTRICPNGEADINHFHAAGGGGFVIRELLDAELLHDDVTTVTDKGLRAHCIEPFLQGEEVVWRPAAATSGNLDVLRPAAEPFFKDGGLRLLRGNLGRAVIKVSAAKPQPPAIVFSSQEDFMLAFKAGGLDRDFVAVVRYQGPRANGMSELHALRRRWQHCRMPGASGTVAAVMHVSPEVLAGGPLGRVRDGDMSRVDASSGELRALVDDAKWSARGIDPADLSASHVGMGRELFAVFWNTVSAAEDGGATFGLPRSLHLPDEHGICSLCSRNKPIRTRIRSSCPNNKEICHDTA